MNIQVAPSLKLNTTIVIRVIDEHLEFPYLHVWYDGPSLYLWRLRTFFKGTNICSNLMMLCKDRDSILSAAVKIHVAFVLWMYHICNTWTYSFSLHTCCVPLKRNSYIHDTISSFKPTTNHTQIQVFKQECWGSNHVLTICDRCLTWYFLYVVF